MKLRDAVERRLHDQDPAWVHARYPAGKCPWCDPWTNLRNRINQLIRGHKTEPPSRPSMTE